MEASSHLFHQFFGRMLMSVPTTTDHDHHSDSHDDHAFESILILLPFCLLLGNVTRHLALTFHIPVPYTVILLVIGVCMGIAEWANQMGVLGTAILEVKTMSPHLLLGVFIPPLIFESAFGTDYHVIRSEFVQAVLLAGPGVIINTILTACFVVYVFPYNWSWTEGITFGSIISATDPVAVVALLRDLGASKRLATLIEGESLLNDGSAFVLFVIAFQFVLDPEDSPSAGMIVQDLCVLTFGGTLFGILFGICAVLWLRFVFNDERVEIVVTLIICYVCFWFCENAGAQHGLEMSGILGTVFLGLFVSKYKSAISPSVEESMHHFWEVFSYIANTLIFIFGGIIVFLGINPDNRLKINAPDAIDFVWLLVLYVVVHITRGLTILILWWPLLKTGYPISWKEGIVLTFAGLRGVIALALVLLVKLTDDEQYPHLLGYEDQTMFHVSGIVFLSLAINGTFMRSIIDALGLLKTSNEAKLILNDAMDHLRRATKTKLEGMKSASSYSGANWEQVAKALPVYAKIIDNQLPQESAPSHGRKICYYCCCYRKKIQSSRYSQRKEILRRAQSASPQIYMSMDTFIQKKETNASRFMSRRFGVKSSYIIPLQSGGNTTRKLTEMMDLTPNVVKTGYKQSINGFETPPSGGEEEEEEEKDWSPVKPPVALAHPRRGTGGGGADDSGMQLDGDSPLRIDLPPLILPKSQLQADQDWADKSGYSIFDKVIRYSSPHAKRSMTPYAFSPSAKRSMTPMEIGDACKHEIVHRILQILKRSYYVSYEEGMLSLDSFMVLEHAVDCALDDNELDLLEVYIVKAFNVNWFVSWAYKRYHNAMTQFFMVQELSLAIEVGKVFISALEEIRGKISCVPAIKNNAYIQDVFEVLMQQEAVIKAKWEKIHAEYPEVYNAIQTRHAVQTILHHEANDILQLFNRGLFDELEYNKMSKLLSQTQHHLFYSSFYDVSAIHEMDETNESYREILISSVLFLSKLSSDEKTQQLLQSVTKAIVKEKNDEIIVKNEKCVNGIYIIVSGTCALLSNNEDSTYNYLSTGAVVGGYEYLSSIPYLNTCLAKTSVALYFIEDATLREVLRDEPQSYESLWKQCAASLILSKYHKNNTSFFAFYNETDINIMCQKSTFFVFDSEEIEERQLLLTSFMALILFGECSRSQEGENGINDSINIYDDTPAATDNAADTGTTDKVFNKTEIIMPHHKPYKFTKNSKVLMFDYDPKKEEAHLIRRRLTRRRKTM